MKVLRKKTEKLQKKLLAYEEIMTMKIIDHPNVITLKDFYKVNGDRFCIFMEFAESKCAYS